jgi:hypothetical protein
LVRCKPPPPLPNLLIQQSLFLDLTTELHLTTIELVHSEFLNPCRTVFNRITLIISYNVSIYSKRYSWVAVPHLLLHHSRVCAICEQDAAAARPSAVSGEGVAQTARWSRSRYRTHTCSCSSGTASTLRTRARRGYSRDIPAYWLGGSVTEHYRLRMIGNKVCGKPAAVLD